MPAGVSDPELGTAAFVAIKLVGYCAAASVISRAFERVPSRWLTIGIARTAIGFLFGYPYFNYSTYTAGQDLFRYWLIPIRLIEWSLLLLIFYPRPFSHFGRAAGAIIGGTVWSFVLDIPAIIGFIVVSGFWIC